MKPILILQHIDSNGPGLFRSFLDEAGRDSELRRPDLGDSVPHPRELGRYAGISLCGGTQSANDDLDWLRAEMNLIRAAAERNVPVIGHCLGGQLMAKALGGSVARHQQPEFGWSQLQRVMNPAAGAWLRGTPETLVAMQWHFDAFTPPPGATPILSGEHCEQQAFALGNLLGMQFHVEPDPRMIRHWAVDLAHLIPEPRPGVQRGHEVMEQFEEKFALSSAFAAALYANWLARCD
jgi:GMP synthase-like glutamine amidotransferase